MFLPALSPMMAGALALAFGWQAAGAQSFRVATYNLENYLLQGAGTREPKTEASKDKIRESIVKLNPDVLAVQELGDRAALEDLRGMLKKAGLDFPHVQHVTGYDTNIFVAVLSKFPIATNRSHTNANFLLNGRRFFTSRGFAEVDIEVNDAYQFTLFTAHLKSKRQIAAADEAEMRLEEAKILREKVDARLAADPNANIVVLGDMNDTKDTPSTRALIGRGRTKLVDTRPAERNGDDTPSPNPAWEPRSITWTHYYGKEDSYSRIDYILLSPGMAREWNEKETHILTVPNWGVASDHRPLVATFFAENK